MANSQLGVLEAINFTKIETQTLNDRVVRVLREAILSGKLKPGTRLNESRLARELGMSRIPLREALQRLEEQGLVVHVPRRGKFVISLSDEEIQRINSVRIILEGEALLLARANCTPEAEAKLAEHVHRWEVEIEKMQPSQGAELDLAIHSTIWQMSGNEYLARALTSLTVPLFAHRVIRLKRWGRNSHVPLLEFVQGKSDKTAQQVILEHLKFGWDHPERFSSLALSSHSNY